MRRFRWLGSLVRAGMAVTGPSDDGTRYACGRYRLAGKTMIVSGGVGTSVLPFRLAAPPDWWLVTVNDADRGAAAGW